MGFPPREDFGPLVLPEIVDLIIANVNLMPDLLSCACVNSLWNILASRKLYRGSLTEMQYRTPDIGSLNCLFIASRERFARNMKSVRHLLLSSDKPLPHKSEDWGDKVFVSAERIRALRRRQDAEVLLRPQARGLISLIVPFMILGQEWSHISDMLLQTNVQFLAIDNIYCSDFNASTEAVGQSAKALDSSPSQNHFPNLKALTVYRSKGHQHISGLLKLLMSCKLEFFCVENHCREQLSPQDIAGLLDCLELQSNLKTLVLEVDTTAGMIGTKNYSRTWPNLKAFYLGAASHGWLEQVSEFKGLQLLRFHTIEFTGIFSNNAKAALTKCKNLRSLDIDLYEVEGTQMLLDIAHSCPNLQNFRAQCADLGAERPFESDLLELIHLLPRIEFLELDWSMVIEGDTFQQLAAHCPKLTVLKVPHILLSISVEELKEVCPLQCLEIMQLCSVFFKDSSHLMKPEIFPILASEWRRVFPKLQAIPCPEDIPNLHIQRTDFSSEDEEEVSTEEEENDDDEEDEEDAERSSDWEAWGYDSSLESVLLNPTDVDNDWFLVRVQLWRDLNYAADKDIHDKVTVIWQRKFEVENIGWPVLPLEVFYKEPKV